MRYKYTLMFIASFVVMLVFAPHASVWGSGEIEVSAEEITSHTSSSTSNLREIYLMGHDEQVRTVQAEIQEGKTV